MATLPLYGEEYTSYKIYQTEKDETLQKIASSPQIYNDPLKWPLIYYLNRAELKKVKTSPEFLPVSPLPPNTLLAILLPVEAEKRLNRINKDNKKCWVINIISSKRKEKVNAFTMRIIDEGYFTYITESKVKEKKVWRVRVGLFKDRKTADLHAKKIADLLKLSDFWVVKATNNEVNEYLGFCK